VTDVRRPVWRTGLAKDAPRGDLHRVRIWPTFLGRHTSSCSACQWSERTPGDVAEVAAAAANHAPRVRVIGPGGDVLADGATEQRRARKRWDRGDATTASEAIKERLNGGDRMDAGNDAGETGDQEEELGMSDRIRAASRVGLSGRRRELKERLFGKDQDAGETGTEDETGDDAGEGGDAP
jgi:hypothetical protein